MAENETQEKAKEKVKVNGKAKLSAYYLLGALLAVGGPFGIYSGYGWWPRISAAFSSLVGTGAPADSADLTPLTSITQSGSAENKPSVSSPSGIGVHQLGEVLRFDVTPNWIVDRWPRVSTGLAQLQLQGYRVPLVTGTGEDDVAGALTYYFNSRQQVQRITLQGATGSTNKLVNLFTTRYGFARRMTNNPGVYLYELPGASGKAESFLWLRPSAVVKSADTHERFEVALVMERPGKR